MALDMKRLFDGARPIFGGSLPQTAVDGINIIVAAWDAAGDGDARKLAYILATAYHETAHTMAPIDEKGGAAYFNKRYGPQTKVGKTLGNTKAGDGARYHGRGFVQLTGRDGYARLGKLVGKPLVDDPSLAKEPETAAKILVIGMLRGLFTGRKLGDYFTSAKADWTNARRIVNGTDRSALIAGYARKFYAAVQQAGGAAATAPAKPKPAAAPAPPAPTAQTITNVQTRLKALGYDPGIVDGKFGSRTKGAILAFRSDHSLPLTAEIDDALLAALMAAGERPVSEERATATPAEVAQHQPGVLATIRTKVAAGVGAGVAAVGAGIDGVGSFISSDGLSDASDKVSVLRDYLSPALWGIALVVACAVTWYAARSQREQVDAFKEGRT